MICAVPNTGRGWGSRRRRAADCGVGWGGLAAEDGRNVWRVTGCARPRDAGRERSGMRSQEHAPESVLVVGAHTGKVDVESVRRASQ